MAGALVEHWRLCLDISRGVCSQRQGRARHSSGYCPLVMPGGARTLTCPVCSWDSRAVASAGEWGREIPAFPRERPKGRISRGTGSGEMKFLGYMGWGYIAIKSGQGKAHGEI